MIWISGLGDEDGTVDGVGRLRLLFVGYVVVNGADGIRGHLGMMDYLNNRKVLFTSLERIVIQCRSLPGVPRPETSQTSICLLRRIQTGKVLLYRLLSNSNVLRSVPERSTRQTISNPHLLITSTQQEPPANSPLATPSLKHRPIS